MTTKKIIGRCFSWIIKGGWLLSLFIMACCFLWMTWLCDPEAAGGISLALPNKPQISLEPEDVFFYSEYRGENGELCYRRNLRPSLITGVVMPGLFLGMLYLSWKGFRA